jgi:pyruvate dehydrogenase E1 component alpha subunit
VHASSDLRSIAQSLGIKTARIDGADVAAVHAAAREAATQCRRGEGPFFMEAVTRRWPGSNPLWPQPATGVTDIRMATGELAIEGEHRAWLEHHDPVLRLARQLTAAGTAAKTRLHALDAAIHAGIENAVRFASDAPLPCAESALDHVFA